MVAMTLLFMLLLLLGGVGAGGIGGRRHGRAGIGCESPRPSARDMRTRLQAVCLPASSGRPPPARPSPEGRSGGERIVIGSPAATFAAPLSSGAESQARRVIASRAGATPLPAHVKRREVTRRCPRG